MQGSNHQQLLLGTQEGSHNTALQDRLEEPYQRVRVHIHQIQVPLVVELVHQLLHASSVAGHPTGPRPPGGGCRAKTQKQRQWPVRNNPPFSPLPEDILLGGSRALKGHEAGVQCLQFLSILAPSGDMLINSALPHQLLCLATPRAAARVRGVLSKRGGAHLPVTRANLAALTR